MLKSTDRPVFLVSAFTVLTCVVVGFVKPQATGEFFATIQSWIVGHLGWFYILSVTGFLGFSIWLMASRYGRIKLGKDDDDPEYSNTAWFAMLFSAGMGIGLLFFGVAEPIFHFIGTRGGEPGSVAAARFAMKTTFFHWGLHAWAIYVVVGLSLAYFAYRHNLPLTIRSTLYPLLGRHIHGPVGRAVEILAVFGTLFGVATSLGVGVVQISAGIAYLGIFESSITGQLLLIAGITALATVSVVSGLDVGIRRLSEFNLALSLLLVLFVFIAGPTVFICALFVESVGHYLTGLIQLTATTDAYEGDGWQGYWTMFYWGWWISWAPFVGMFIARISRGRTIRSFVAGALLVPTLLTFVWMVVFGGTALHMELFPVNDAMNSLSQVVGGDGTPELALFAMLQNLPLSTPLIVVAIVVIATYFVTSSDSASLVVDILTTGGNPNPPTWSRVFWAVTEGAIAAALLYAGYRTMDDDGSALLALKALQNAAIVTALPFCVVMIFICFSLVRGLRAERDTLTPEVFLDTPQTPLGEQLPAEALPDEDVPWREQLRAILGRTPPAPAPGSAPGSPPTDAGTSATSRLAVGRQRAMAFIQDPVLVAFADLKRELENQGRTAEVLHQPYQATLVVRRDGVEEFRYGVRARVLRRAATAFPELQDDDVPREVKGVVVLRGGLARDYPIDRFTRQNIVEDFLGEYAKWVGW